MTDELQGLSLVFLSCSMGEYWRCVWRARLSAVEAGVAADHVPESPSGEAHQVGFVAAGGPEGVGEGMTDLVWVNLGDAGLDAATLERLGDPRAGESASFAEPEPGLVGMGVDSAGMNMYRSSSLMVVGEIGSGPLPPAFPDYHRHPEVPVDVFQP